MKRTALSVSICVFFSLCLRPSLLFLPVRFSLSLCLLVSAMEVYWRPNKFKHNSSLGFRERHGSVRAELDLYTREDRIMSVTDDFSMQEELCNYIWATSRDSRARNNQSYSRWLVAAWFPWAESHLFNLTWKLKVSLIWGGWVYCDRILLTESYETYLWDVATIRMKAFFQNRRRAYLTDRCE